MTGEEREVLRTPCSLLFCGIWYMTDGEREILRTSAPVSAFFMGIGMRQEENVRFSSSTSTTMPTNAHHASKGF